MTRKGTVIWDNKLLRRLCQACREIGYHEYWPDYMKKQIRKLAKELGIKLPTRN